MKRKIYQQLLDWKEKRNGEVALLIDGARRIGKSYIVEEFAKNEYESYILIDFNKAGSSLLIMAMFGGAVLPTLYGSLKDAVGAQQAYWLCLPCFLYILYYSIHGYKIRS